MNIRRCQAVGCAHLTTNDHPYCAAHLQRRAMSGCLTLLALMAVGVLTATALVLLVVLAWRLL